MTRSSVPPAPAAPDTQLAQPAAPKGPAAEQAYETIRDRIFSGGLSEDDRVTEVDLAESLNMSRTPVREAVKRLLLEGLLTRDAGPGLRVVAAAAAAVARAPTAVAMARTATPGVTVTAAISRAIRLHSR